MAIIEAEGLRKSFKARRVVVEAVQEGAGVRGAGGARAVGVVADVSEPEGVEEYLQAADGPPPGRDPDQLLRPEADLREGPDVQETGSGQQPVQHR